MAHFIYKICPRTMWVEAQKTGVFEGAPIDLQDGYIHFSTAEQVRETAAKHFAGQDDLFLIRVDGDRLGDALKYEISRGGKEFPHLYAPLDLAAVVETMPLPLGDDGQHQFPEGLN